MPGIDSDTAFWIVVAMCGAILVALAALFRLKRWL
jgi:Mg2+ and Co2+ transporter CorA